MIIKVVRKLKTFEKSLGGNRIFPREGGKALPRPPVGTYARKHTHKLGPGNHEYIWWSTRTQAHRCPSQRGGKLWSWLLIGNVGNNRLSRYLISTRLINGTFGISKCRCQKPARARIEKKYNSIVLNCKYILNWEESVTCRALSRVSECCLCFWQVN